MSVSKLILIKELICHQTRLVLTPHRFLLYYYLIYLLSLHACIVDRNENIVCHLSLQNTEIVRVSKTVSAFKICRWEEISLQCFFFLSQGVFVVPAALQVLLRSVAGDDVWRRDCCGRFYVLGWKWFGREVRSKAATVKKMEMEIKMVT